MAPPDENQDLVRNRKLASAIGKKREAYEDERGPLVSQWEFTVQAKQPIKSVLGAIMTNSKVLIEINSLSSIYLIISQNKKEIADEDCF